MLVSPTDSPPMAAHDGAVLGDIRPQVAYEYSSIMQQGPGDIAAHLSMPHIPLPLETPLPPSAYQFMSQGSFQLSQSLPGPQAHPLYQGVVGMHQFLGHELAWSDVNTNSQCTLSHTSNQESYPCESPLDIGLQQWPASGAQMMDPSPSPLEQPQQKIAEQSPELVPDEAHSPDESATDVSLPTPTMPAPHTGGFTMFPLVVTAAKTHEHTIAFQTDRQRSEKTSTKLDPYAADFIRHKLGEQRWSIFFSRLAERRAGTQKPKSKGDGSSSGISTKTIESAFAGEKSAGASALDFLVKVEVVKGVLRAYVPHPYNPLKTLSHPYAPAPSGQVTLSRSAILSLSGWSNTQFSYWARRAEAISVLALHDDRLRTVATALERRLRAHGLSETSEMTTSFDSTSHNVCPSMGPSDNSNQLDMDPDEWVRTYVTGKGLDVIIDEVKKRTGVSPFLRGKHSSLDPFGTVSVECAEGNVKKAPVYMPTFQAEKYVHEVPPEVDATALSGVITGGKKGSIKRKASSPPPETVASDDSWPSANEESEDYQFTFHISNSRAASSSPSLAHALDESLAGPSFSAGYEIAVSNPRLMPADHSGAAATIRPMPSDSSLSGRAKKRRLSEDVVAQLNDSMESSELGLYHRHLETG